MAKFKVAGVLSHMRGQAAALLEWVQADRIAHVIYVRMYDDTNIWVSPQTRPGIEELDEAEQPELDPDQEDDAAAGDVGSAKKAGRVGRKRVQQALQMIQYLTVRRANAVIAGLNHLLDSARVFCPCQVLPKARRKGEDDQYLLTVRCYIVLVWSVICQCATRIHRPTRLRYMTGQADGQSSGAVAVPNFSEEMIFASQSKPCQSRSWSIAPQLDPQSFSC